MAQHEILRCNDLDSFVVAKSEPNWVYFQIFSDPFLRKRSFIVICLVDFDFRRFQLLLLRTKLLKK